ncbi:hypothetical protein [Colwellia sp. BRX9-1]|uniref:hypothetical protein n=1 Tax=Colwellia sp. BRX9-1 TaxID=2759830 RepID=UPI0015F3F3C2|nr:hypothetical protein [Colwellia sp. BRX9-1]MBA6353595.1 hypothetical protein [Colwellia sp. BRX9-1]
MTTLNYACFKSFFIFVCIIYLPGLLFFLGFEKGYMKYYNFDGGLYSAFIILFPLFNLIVFLCFYYLGKIPIIRFSRLNSNLSLFLIFVVSFCYFLLSVNFSLNFTSSFRHINRLSNAGPLVSLLFLMKPMMFFIVALMLIHILNGSQLGGKSRFALFLILIASVLSLNSSLHFLAIPILLCMLFKPKVFLLTSKDINWRNMLVAMFFVPVVASLVIFIGIGNKVGYAYLISAEGIVFLKGYGDILFPRMSTSLFSSVIMLQHSFDGISYSNDIFDAITSTLYNRFSLILPLDNFDSSLINTVNRLNYMVVFANHAERAGASPGIISSVFYTPLFPLTLVIIPVYVFILYRSLAYHMNQDIKLNLLSCIVLPFLLLNLFESPINIFYLLDPIFILFFTVVFLGKFIDINTVFTK